MTRRLIWALVLLFGLCAPARAHDPGMTVATVIVEEHETLIELSVKGSDLAQAAGVVLLDPEGNVDPERLAGAAAAVGAHLRATAAIEAETAVCPLEVVELVAVEDGILAVLKAHYWFLPARWLVLDKWDVASRIGMVSAPVLVVQGEADRVIPVRFGKWVFELASEPKAALFHPRAGHNDLFDYPEVVERVIAFVREQVPGTAADLTEAHNAAD